MHYTDINSRFQECDLPNIEIIVSVWFKKEDG